MQWNLLPWNLEVAFKQSRFVDIVFSFCWSDKSLKIVQLLGFENVYNEICFSEDFPLKQ